MAGETKQTDSKALYDVVGIGNAIVDVISHEDEKFLDSHNLIKDSMALIDTETAVSLYNEMSQQFNPLEVRQQTPCPE